MSSGAGRLVDENRRHWDERVPIHAASEFYDLDGFRDGTAEVLDGYQLDEVGDVTGLDVAHLQCHIGLDTLEWARRGAATVAGLDFSPEAVRLAGQLAQEIGVADRARFVAADVYEAPGALGTGRFDLVYTGAGALMWLPDIARWAEVVAGLLRPGGRLYLTEFHPLTDVLDDDTGTTAARDYFRRGARTYDSPGTYADWTADTRHNAATEWHHTLGDILTAVAQAGLRIEFVREREEIPFQRYGALVAGPTGFRYPEGTAQLPLMYSLAATREDRLTPAAR